MGICAEGIDCNIINRFELGCCKYTWQACLVICKFCSMLYNYLDLHAIILVIFALMTKLLVQGKCGLMRPLTRMHVCMLLFHLN